MTHHIRHLQIAEIDFFLTLYQNIFPSKNISKANVQSIFNTEPAEVWVCADAAFLYFWRVPDGYEVIDLGVHPDFRRQGLGEALMQQLLNKAQNENAKVFLEVAEQNLAALALYQKMGFEFLQKRKNYYGQQQDALVLCWPCRLRSGS